MHGRSFDAGSLALTFVDRVALQALVDYADLVERAIQIDLVDPNRGAWLLDGARTAAFRADEVLAEARVLARVIQRIFTAVARSTRPAAGDMDFLKGSLARAMAHLTLAPATTREGPGFRWTWQGNGADHLDAVLWPVVRDAAELLVGQDPARIRLCAGPVCERLFVDRSKAGRRRWCRMETCGNRAKARRHAGRQKPPTPR